METECKTSTKELSVTELKEAIQKLHELKVEKERIEELLDIATVNMKVQEALILDCLQRNDLENFKVPGVLSVSVKNEFFIKQPESVEDVNAFNKWLADNGMEWMRKVNSQSLNSLYREQMEKAAERGEIVAIPGLGMPTTRVTLMKRKG